MKLKHAFAALVLTVGIVAASKVLPVPVPTCDPRDPKCTMQNGCDGGPCAVN